MKKQLLAMVMVLCLLTAACGKETTPAPANNPPATPEQKISFTRETFPKVDGSTATIPLSEAVAAKLLSLSKEESAKFIKHNTTHNAYVNLINKKADIILVTEPSEEELKLAKEANIELEVVPVVKEGFVFLVNTKNPVNSLTTKEIQDIYQGKIKNWKEVGGENKELVAFQREPNSGSQTLMEQKVMAGLQMIKSPKIVIQGMGELIERIAKYDNSDKALGYSVFYYAKTMYNRDTIKLIAVNGIKPDNKTIASGQYPFTTAYYAVIRKSDPAEASSRQLLKWLLGEEGQSTAEQAGYVPLKVR